MKHAWSHFPPVPSRQVFDAEAVDTWSLGTTLFMALLGVQPWEEVGDYKFQAIAKGKNLDVVLQGWQLRDGISDEAVDLLQVSLPPALDCLPYTCGKRLSTGVSLSS